MALAKKGTRLIKVNDVEYRWVVHPDDEPGMAIVVECADNPGQRMITWVEYGNIISPWLVRRAILHALDRGWYPQQKGAEIVFRLEGIVSREDNWTGVPSEHKAAWQDVFQASQESLHLSAPCPVCGVTALCRWYYIGGKPIKTEIEGVTFVLNGDLWEWCSNCHIFQHYSCLVPRWWSCDLDVNTEKLTALPKAIEKAMKARDISFYSNSSKIASF
ncbi:hypothetical protein QUA43_06740 [Microcoleus sp. N9_B4]|uniref:hypothetical protein n=1 Tax=Microcoleus sp. N9_B4 TaxID=3055386 RepID=UPI002FD748A9